MGTVGKLLLSVIAFGMLGASAVQPDAFLAQAQLLCAGGAFGLAWLLPN